MRRLKEIIQSIWILNTHSMLRCRRMRIIFRINNTVVPTQMGSCLPKRAHFTKFHAIQHTWIEARNGNTITLLAAVTIVFRSLQNAAVRLYTICFAYFSISLCCLHSTSLFRSIHRNNKCNGAWKTGSLDRNTVMVLFRFFYFFLLSLFSGTCNTEYSFRCGFYCSFILFRVFASMRFMCSFFFFIFLRLAEKEFLLCPSFLVFLVF